MSRYPVHLTFHMVVALVDIDNGNEDETSSRYITGTLKGLVKRKLVDWTGNKLTKKGQAYLTMALFEYAECAREIEAHAIELRRAKKAKRAVA